MLWISPEKRPQPNKADANGILVADDNQLNQRMLMLMLRHVGLSCDLASNGLETVNACEGKTYRLILLDIDMPVMDGLEATRRIRADSRIEQPAIIAVTASDVSENRCREAGMDGMINKPLKVQRLKKLLNQLRFIDETGHAIRHHRADTCSYAH